MTDQLVYIAIRVIIFGGLKSMLFVFVFVLFSSVCLYLCLHQFISFIYIQYRMINVSFKYVDPQKLKFKEANILLSIRFSQILLRPVNSVLRAIYKENRVRFCGKAGQLGTKLRVFVYFQFLDSVSSEINKWCILD